MNIFKKTLSILLVLGLAALCLCSCIKKDTARGTIEDFLSKIEAEDYEGAQAMLHPEKPADLKALIAEVEAADGVDFQSGIEIVKYTSTQSAHYDSTVNGSSYGTSLKVKIGESDATVFIKIVDNDKGYGIYNFEVTVKNQDKA